jgi:hypothetical protein
MITSTNVKDEAQLTNESRQILAIGYTAIQIALAKYGGGGKHIYDVTYHEFYIFKMVGRMCDIYSIVETD